MFDHEMRDAAERVLLACRARKLKVVTAESCTGGLVAATLTAIAGSSDVVERGFVTYASGASADAGCPQDALLGHGAVRRVARTMAAAHSQADVSVSVTGVAGPAAAQKSRLAWFIWRPCGRATSLSPNAMFSGDLTGPPRLGRLPLAMLASLAVR